MRCLNNFPQKAIEATYGMEFKPVRVLVKITSLTTIPAWRRYRYLKDKRPKIKDQRKSLI
jgi:hypothetical protein